MNTLPAGLGNNDRNRNEFFTDDNTVYGFYHGQKIHFSMFPDHILDIYRKEMKRMPSICASMGITPDMPPDKKLELYLANHYGKLDNIPDIDEEGNTNDELDGEHACQEYNITRREKEVMMLIAVGFHDNEIANRLFISPLTVARHRHNILEKTSMRNASDITRFACKKNLV